MRFPAGFMDVVTIDKTKENFRLLYDTKGRFVVHKIHRDEATYKLLRVNQVTKTTGNIKRMKAGLEKQRCFQN